MLLGKLRIRLAAEERLRDRKNRALREKRSSDAQNLTLQLQHDASVLRSRELRETIGSLRAEKRELEDEAKTKSKVQTRTTAKGRPYSDNFEAHAVRSMATGISAKHCRDQMILDGAFLDAGEGFVVPEIDWFERLRERIGNESLLYAFVKIACAEEVLQHGSDETGIHRQGTYNQWVKIRNEHGEFEIVYIETAGSWLVPRQPKSLLTSKRHGSGARHTSTHCGKSSATMPMTSCLW